MNVSNHPAADEEMSEAAVYLEGQLPGYGALFLATAARMRNTIAEFPEMFPEKMPSVRFCTMPIFRYVMPYCILGEDVVILAYAHTNREPNYWRNRLTTI